jgi:hypothetical protein
MKLQKNYLGILFVGIIFPLTACGQKSTVTENQTPLKQDTVTQKKIHTKTNTFEGLRNAALHVTPEQLGLKLPEDKTVVFGVLMDWDMKGTTVTTVSYQTGDASMYLSSGGGVIGGGTHKNVNRAARTFVNTAQTFIAKAAKTETTKVPGGNMIFFYLLTNNGVFKGQDEMKNFENNTSNWKSLFEAGNQVLTELRLTTEK